MNKIKYDLSDLDFKKDWLVHKNCKEWWYATGVLFDGEKNLYSYQYTLLHINFGLITLKCAMTALTDFKNDKHYYLQQPALLSLGKVIIDENEASFKGVAHVKKQEKGISLELSHSKFNLSLTADYGKGAFWHCDGGKLQMGIPDEKETTLYYSYTNMPTSGYVTLNGEKIYLEGKTWFDKQGGTYAIANPKTHWEWFSLRFFDDEEIMLFTFPQDDYFDGTYITKTGATRRLNDYDIKNTSVITVDNMKWSAGWKLRTGVKDREYTIEPIRQGHINFAYFEELCYIKDRNNKVVGYCFAELLPGILNAGSKEFNIGNLFKRIEY
ncbi:MAG: hypothetical protein LBP62_06270 [Clostridiales bacterium]|jgi:predicted secreted hydrolase|nr:hypothetical protein [Clostridiales bacterium]